MSESEALRERFEAVMMPNYGTPPLALARGAGCRVWDADGNQYLDLIAGIAASATPGSCTNRLELCASLAAWLLTAVTMAGGAWPSALTAMPAIRSRYWLPSASQTRHPAPRARASGGVP